MGNAHVISIIIGTTQVKGWTEYTIESSMVEPADSFRLTRAFDLDTWRLCDTDQEVRVMCDGTVLIHGYIDGRGRDARAGSMTIHGRDKVGRLVQESAPDFEYSGKLLSGVVASLAKPWFANVVFTDQRNRRVRRGNGGAKAPSGTEPVILDAVLQNGHIDAGRTRWAIIEDLIGQAGLIAWSSADGKELIVGKPNYTQGIQYIVRHTEPGSANRSTCKNLLYDEDIGDRYSRIVVTGAGAGDATNYGKNVCGRRAEYRNGPAADGTGIDFIRPKLLVLPEQSLRSVAQGQQVVNREAARRNFKAKAATAIMPRHGQVVSDTTGAPTLFAPNTMVQVIDEELRLEDPFIVYACSYSSSRRAGETTKLAMVPKGTEIVP